MRKAIVIIEILYLLYPTAVLADIKEAAGIPYEDNDNSYVTVPSMGNEEEQGDFNFSQKERVDLRTLAASPCAEVPLLLDQCRAALCQATTPFGNVYRKIVGFNQTGECQYLERSPTLGGVNCSFPASELVSIGKILDGYYSGLQTNSSPEAARTEAVKKIYATYCATALDQDIRNIITMDMPTGNANIFAPNVNVVVPSTQQPPVSTSSDPLASPASYGIGNQQLKAGATTLGVASISPHINTTLRSVAFREQELQSLLEAVQRYEAKSHGARKRGGSLYDSYILYLNSVLHLAEDKWVVWLNDSRVRGSRPRMNLDILGVQPGRVYFRWIVSNLDNMAPGWKGKAIQIDASHYQIKDYPIEVTILSEMASSITFALQTNQTFVIQQMHISEGRTSGMQNINQSDLPIESESTKDQMNATGSDNKAT